LEKKYQEHLEQLRKQLQNHLPDCHGRIPNNDSDIDAILSSNALDDLLVRYVMLYQATPKGLATAVASDTEQETLIEQALDIQNRHMSVLLKDMLLADGPKDNQYGKALQVYHDILEISEHVSENDATGVLQRLALAMALEHATPLKQENPKKPPPDAEEFVDPIRRYLNYKMAFEQGELDPNFELLSVWELRFVVDGAEPDETAAWGREMLKNYRPDHVLDPNLKSRYVCMVNSNIRYGSGDVKYDRDDWQLYPNILLTAATPARLSITI
jgi:hypothetical protein